MTMEEYSPCQSHAVIKSGSAAGKPTKPGPCAPVVYLSSADKYHRLPHRLPRGQKDL